MTIARVALLIILTASTMVVFTVLAITLLEWIQGNITARCWGEARKRSQP